VAEQEDRGEGFSFECSNPDDKTTVIAFTGEFKGMEVTKAEDEILKKVKEAKGQIVIDLKGAPYMDSSAIALFNKCAKTADSHELPKLILLAPMPGVRKVLMMMKMDEIFHIKDDFNPADYEAPEGKGESKDDVSEAGQQGDAAESGSDG